MKQFSSAQLNKMSREDLVAMVLQMQQQKPCSYGKALTHAGALFWPFYGEAQHLARTDEAVQ